MGDYLGHDAQSGGYVYWFFMLSKGMAVFLDFNPTLQEDCPHQAVMGMNRLIATLPACLLPALTGRPVQVTRPVGNDDINQGANMSAWLSSIVTARQAIVFCTIDYDLFLELITLLATLQ